MDLYKAAWSSLKVAGSLCFETSHRRKNGLAYPVEVTAKHLEFKGKEYSCTFSRDITARNEAANALRQAEQQHRLAQKLEAIGQLTAGIAHEINTPIQYIGDNGQFLSDAFGDLEKVLGPYYRLNESHDSAQVLLEEMRLLAAGVDLLYLRREIPNAIRQLLDGVTHVARIVRAMGEFSHSGPVDKSPADINRAIESAVVISRNEWKYVAEVTTDLDAGLPPVPCVVGEFSQVILNLIVNAAHAIADIVKDSGGKGAIRIGTRRNGGFAEIRVSDTGGGIPEAIRSKVFDPFFTTKAVGKGTGQGLAIAQSVIVRKHGGTLSFESEDGVGTTFLIQLPLVT
jgi:signal transduction histidine kinase